MSQLRPVYGANVTKDPDSVEPRGLDWTKYLAELDPSETIASSAWAVSGEDSALTLSGDAIGEDGLTTQITLAGGTLGVTYTVRNRITTSSSVVDDRSFRVTVAQQ